MEEVFEKIPNTKANIDKFGEGVFLTDIEIVDLLRKPPKSTPALRTKTNFQTFFKGISSNRIEGLLTEAFSNLSTVEDQMEKVAKRMDILKEVVE
jgi:hypothetical protein